jgi:hypothetical protein
MSVQAIRGVVEAAIQRASNATGVDFDFLMHAARRESGFNPNAKASTSSAAGLFQFVDQTWLATLKRHGAKYGYARYADLIEQGADGKYRVSGQEARATVMNLRLDPHASALMAGELAADHAAYLRGRVGREPTAGELYLAHVLGPSGSAKMIDAARQSPAASAASLFPEAAQSNHGLFFRDGRAATIAEVYQDLTRGPGGAGVVKVPPAGQPDQGFVQYASARRQERVAEERAVVDLVLRGPEAADDMGLAAKMTSGMFSTEMLRTLSESEERDAG